MKCHILIVSTTKHASVDLLHEYISNKRSIYEKRKTIVTKKENRGVVIFMYHTKLFLVIEVDNII